MSGLSWDGHNVFGSRDSINEVQRLLRVEARVNQLQGEVMRLQILLNVEKEKNATTAVRHRE
jgi:hypothetical protein